MGTGSSPVDRTRKSFAFREAFFVASGADPGENRGSAFFSGQLVLSCTGFLCGGFFRYAYYSDRRREGRTHPGGPAEEHDVTIIDRSDEVIEKCQDSLDVMCVRGNGANAKTLVEAGVDRADVVIATTAGDETNMLSCLLAKRMGAKYTIARIRDPEFNESQMLLQNEMGIDAAINPEREALSPLPGGRLKWWNSGLRRMISSPAFP